MASSKGINEGFCERREAIEEFKAVKTFYLREWRCHFCAVCCGTSTCSSFGQDVRGDEGLRVRLACLG